MLGGRDALSAVMRLLCHCSRSRSRISSGRLLLMFVVWRLSDLLSGALNLLRICDFDVCCRTLPGSAFVAVGPGGAGMAVSF